MPKKLLFLFVTFLFASTLFAQTEAVTANTQTVNVSESFSYFPAKASMAEQIRSDGNIKVEYSPSEDIVCISYTTTLDQFERVTARDSVLEVLDVFLKLPKYVNESGEEHSKTAYNNFDFIQDREKYFREGSMKKVQYISRIKASKS